MELNALRLEELGALVGRWGYLVVFAGMVLESAGLPLPGETLTLLGGYAAGSGQLHPGGVVAAAASGAVLGDTLGYWIGRRFGWRLILRLGRLLRQRPNDLQRLRAGFLRRAALAVFLGRFVAVLRVLAGPMAGAVGMPYRRFLACNVAGAVLWSTAMVSLAWICGSWMPIERLLSGVVQAGVVALLLLALVAVVPWLLSRLESPWLNGSRPPAAPAPGVRDGAGGSGDPPRPGGR